MIPARIAPILTALAGRLLLLNNVVIVASFDSVNSRVIFSLDDLPFDENGHLASHILAYPASDPCAGLIEAALPTNEENMYLHTPIAVAGDAVQALFGDIPLSGGEITDVMQCPAVCLVRGVDASLVGYPLPEKYYNPERNEAHTSFPNFISSDSCGKVEYAFVNYSPKALSMYWINSNGEKIFTHALERLDANTRFVGTYLGHRFTLEDLDTGEVMLDHTIEFVGTIGVSNHKNYKDQSVSVHEEVHTQLNHMWDKHFEVKRTFTPLGFNKGRLPNDVFASMRAFYYNNRDYPHRLQEEWSGGSVFVNHWESDCNFIMIPWSLKRIWQSRLKDVVQAWVGCEIEQTDMYGIRQYEAGARLLTHVDRINTHAVSLIVNIAQGNLTDAWTVEVYDHANRLHEVVMEPGDIVYYESAKSLHGRNTPLAGGYYANLFTHYRPIGDPLWYSKDNPEGTPEPLMDVGKCELVGLPNEYSQGAVKCENPAIGPHLSPKMFTATSGDDLYNLWLSVGLSSGDETSGMDQIIFSDESDEL